MLTQWILNPDVKVLVCLDEAKMAEFDGYIVMLRARMFRSLIPILMIKERNIRARNITI